MGTRRFGAFGNVLVFAIGGLLLTALLAGCSKKRCEPCGKDADCASGLACDRRSSVCKVPNDEQKCAADCKVSSECKESGNCTLGTLMGHEVCAAKSDEDCKLRDVCKQTGKGCKFHAVSPEDGVCAD